MLARNVEAAFHSKPKTLALAAGLFVLVVAAYVPAIRNGFLYDDYLLILDPPPLHSAGDVAKLFARPYYTGLPYYRPLTSASFLIQRALQGEAARPFHLANVLLAGALAVLVYGLLSFSSFGLAKGIAPAAAAVFALHPVVSSCVYPISGRDTLLAIACIVASVRIYLAGTVRAALASAVVFGAGLLTKEAAVVVPGLLVLAELCGLAGSSRRGTRELVPRALPFAVVLAVYAGLRAFVLPAGQLAAGKLAYVALAYLYALQVTLVPFGALLYEPPVGAWLSPWRLAVVTLLVLGAIAAGRTAGRAVRGVIWFGVAWFVVAQLPTANLLRQETQFDERYVTPALVGLVIAAAALVSSLGRAPRGRRIATAGAWALAAGLACVGLARGPSFEEVAFYRQWLAIKPTSMTARFNLANALAKRGALDEAVPAYRAALELDPGHAPAHNNFGETLVRLGKREDAIEQFRDAIRIDPRNVKAHNNLGSALALGGDLSGAISEFREALRLDPAYVGAMFDLGYALVLTGANDEAIERLTEVLRLSPGYVKARKPLALALLRSGRADEAAAELEKVLRSDPGDAEAKRLLEAARRGSSGRSPAP